MEENLEREKSRKKKSEWRRSGATASRQARRAHKKAKPALNADSGGP
jgi:hypothetical protein